MPSTALLTSDLSNLRWREERTRREGRGKGGRVLGRGDCKRGVMRKGKEGCMFDWGAGNEGDGASQGISFGFCIICLFLIRCYSPNLSRPFFFPFPFCTLPRWLAAKGNAFMGEKKTSALSLVLFYLAPPLLSSSLHLRRFLVPFISYRRPHKHCGYAVSLLLYKNNFFCS